MVYGFAKQSDGAFRLESGLGKGTTAELWLPRAPEAVVADAVGLVEPESHQLRALRVLLVDDHPEVRSTTAAILEDGGHAVIQADNGLEALALIDKRDGDFDLLITDYAMPHLSGTDFLREAQKSHPAVPALMITGYAETEMINHRPAGVEMLLKPFTPATLEAAIARACGAEMTAIR
jgi:CheY-like chemotaxis protein